MKRIQLYAAGVAVALVPAVVGLAGNASFSQSVPVRSPASGTTDDPATHDATDDRVTGVDDSAARPSSTPTPHARATRTARPAPRSDEPATHDANDDRGGLRDRSGSSGPGSSGGADDPATHDANDDHGGLRDRSGSSGSSGSDDSGGDDSGSGHSGSGGDDSSDDGGSGGHGSDD